MPANLRSRLSRLLGALLTLLASPLAASARLVVGSTGVTYAAKRFEPSGVSATYFECPTYGPDNVAPTLPEGTDNGVTTTCNYAFEGGPAACEYDDVDGGYLGEDIDCSQSARVCQSGGGRGGASCGSRGGRMRRRTRAEAAIMARQFKFVRGEVSETKK